MDLTHAPNNIAPALAQIQNHNAEQEVNETTHALEFIKQLCTGIDFEEQLLMV